MILDFMKDDVESKENKQVLENIDPSLEEKILIVNNMPCLFLLFMSEDNHDDESEELFVEFILPLIDRLTLDSSKEVRSSCALVLS
jgi:hypothetical protein